LLKQSKFKADFIGGTLRGFQGRKNSMHIGTGQTSQEKSATPASVKKKLKAEFEGTKRSLHGLQESCGFYTTNLKDQKLYIGFIVEFLLNVYEEDGADDLAGRVDCVEDADRPTRLTSSVP
jgi:hypothetical protein